MAQNTGTLISSAIRPNDSLDPIASAFANEVKGGLHGYSTISERDSIISERREWGMFVVVYNDASPSNNKTYQLTYGYFNTDINNNLNWKEFSQSSGSSGSEWLNSVISVSYVQPATPSTSDRYLVGLKPGDSISGSVWGLNSAGFISEYNLSLSTWDIISPTQGMTIRVDNEPNHIYSYRGVYPSGQWFSEKVSQVFQIEPLSISGVTYSVGTTPSFNSYSKDIIFLSKFVTTNSATSSLMLNINNIGDVPIKKATSIGILDLDVNEIIPNITYSLTYDGSIFQLVRPFSQGSDGKYVNYYIPLDDEIIVQQYEQYWVYGDLTIDGKLINYGQVIIADGNMNLGITGTFSNYGELHIIDISVGITGSVGPTGSVGEGLHKPIKTITGTTYSLISEDKNRWLKFTNNSSITVTVPDLVFSDGDLIEGYQMGNGQITFTSSGGLTLTKSADEELRTAIDGAVFGLKYESASSAHLFGKLELL